MSEMKATTKRQAKVPQDNETELLRWCKVHFLNQPTGCHCQSRRRVKGK